MKTEYIIKEKINKFRNICETIHRHLRNITAQNARLKFYKTIAIPTLTYASEAWVMIKKKKAARFRVPKCSSFEIL